MFLHGFIPLVSRLYTSSSTEPRGHFVTRSSLAKFTVHSQTVHWPKSDLNTHKPQRVSLAHSVLAFWGGVVGLLGWRRVGRRSFILHFVIRRFQGGFRRRFYTCHQAYHRLWTVTLPFFFKLTTFKPLIVLCTVPVPHSNHTVIPQVGLTE